jgi:15-cis-phytoene synthase/lycopene beta-cyclase
MISWTITGHFLLALPSPCTAWPVVIPTLYLWLVDELALGRGTWAIEEGTKLGTCIYGNLEVEEAIFFFATNTLIVFGLAAFDKAVAVTDAFPSLFAEPSNAISSSILRARLTPSSAYDMQRIFGIRLAVQRLQRKSRSFYLASSVFPGRLRIDLTLL